MISGFSGKFKWLSNFYPATIIANGHTFVSVEHAYVAAKPIMPLSPFDVIWLNSLSAGKVKRVGRDLDLRPDWDAVKLDVMLDYTRQKYSDQNPELKALLKLTVGHDIVETNTWGDTFWGMTPEGEGHNWLGIIIMSVRDEL